MDRGLNELMVEIVTIMIVSLPYPHGNHTRQDGYTESLQTFYIHFQVDIWLELIIGNQDLLN